MSGTVDQVLRLVSSYGYVFLLAASVAENTFIVGMLVPGDLAVVIGGAAAAGARLQFLAVVASVVLGGWVGTSLSFWIGRRGGVALIERWGARFAISHDKVSSIEAYFRTHGAKTVFLATFVAGLKNVVPSLAGASNMGFVRFVGYSFAGTALRGMGLVGVGYWCGANLPEALAWVGKANGWLLGLLVAPLLVLVLVRVRRARAARASSGEHAGALHRKESGASDQDRVDRGTP